MRHVRRRVAFGWTTARQRGPAALAEASPRTMSASAVHRTAFKLTPKGSGHGNLQPMALQIYLVEDDARLRASVGEAINSICDAEVIGTAETEDQAVAWLNGHHGFWRLAVLDLFLKSGTGFGVLQRLIPRDASEQVIVLTNSATRENRNRCLGLGALAVYDKTVQFEEFLDHCLRHHQQTPT